MKSTHFLSIFTLLSIGFMSFQIAEKPIPSEEGLVIEIPLSIDEVDEEGWGPWTTTDCLKGLDFRVQQGGYNRYADKYKWNIEYRNRYYEKIHFGTDVVPMSQKHEIRSNPKTSSRVNVNPNNDTYSTWFLVKAKSQVYVYIHKIRFGKDYGDYSNCDK